jgi:MFS family permease
LGTLLLALTLGLYALAVTTGRGGFGPLNLALLLTAGVGAGVFMLVQRRAASPLIRFAMINEFRLGPILAMSAIVSTVLMSTLVVGPFYLAGALGLEAARVGLVLSVGSLIAALTGVPAGRLVDHFGTERMTSTALIVIVAGSLLLSAVPLTFGVIGYLSPMILITAGYALFQAANSTAAMEDVGQDQRGVVAGLLNLSRNLGLITGASLMGTVFMVASGAKDITATNPEFIATGMRITFAVATALTVLAFAITLGRQQSGASD